MNRYGLLETYTIKLVKYAWIIYHCESHTIIADYINFLFFIRYHLRVSM